MELYKIPNLVVGTIVKRPSQHCKTPYVADVRLEDGTMVMAHTAALGCSGLADAGGVVIMQPVENKKNVCSHKILMVKQTERNTERILGIDPKMAETLAEECLKNNCIRHLEDVVSYKREQKRLNSRFDFVGVDRDNKEFVMEIKNVPLADYVDCFAKEKKGKDFSNIPMDKKISYFPDGYRKKKSEPVSPRALKHIQELQKLIEEHDVRAILCFVIQRRDSSRFQPSNVDPIYQEAVKRACESGVEIKTIQIEWKDDGTANFVRNDLPIHIYDTHI